MNKEQIQNAKNIIKGLRLSLDVEYEAIKAIAGTEVSYGDLRLKAPEEGYFMKPLSGEDHRVFFISEKDFAAYERALLSLDLDRVQRSLEDYFMLPSGKRLPENTNAA